jgi:hypothetical protein
MKNFMTSKFNIGDLVKLDPSVLSRIECGNWPPIWDKIGVVEVLANHYDGKGDFIVEINCKDWQRKILDGYYSTHKSESEDCKPYTIHEAFLVIHCKVATKFEMFYNEKV